jgi:hypothetical protein
MTTHDDERAFVRGFAIQLFPTWLAVVILIAVAFGVWKLAKRVWVAIAS